MRQLSWAWLIVFAGAGTLGAQWPDEPARGDAPPARSRFEPEPADAPSDAPGITTFDYRQADLRLHQNRWQVVADGRVLKDFGPREADAREGLRLIRLLRLNQHAFIGQSRPVLEFWLSDGQAPFLEGQQSKLLPIDLNSLEVTEQQGQWVLRDAKRLFFVFGASRDDAFYTFDVIRYYGFKHLGYIGFPQPTMLYFLGSGQARATALPPPKRFQPPAKSPEPDRDSPITPTSFTPARNGLANSRVVAIDQDKLAVRREQNDWKLFHGGLVIANFGTAGNQAKEALGLLRLYQVTDMIQVGQPTSFTFFLVNGQAPRGVRAGLTGQPFVTTQILARPLGKNWMVCEGDRPLLSLGPHPGDAQFVVQAIQRHRFDFLGRIGIDDKHSLTLLVKTK